MFFRAQSNRPFTLQDSRNERVPLREFPFSLMELAVLIIIVQQVNGGVAVNFGEQRRNPLRQGSGI